MFLLLPDEIINIILSQLDFKDLIDAFYINKHILMLLCENNFWRYKYEKDFLVGIDNYVFNIKWKELYCRASNVNTNYPKIFDVLGKNNIGFFYYGMVRPTLESKDPKDLIEALTINICGCTGITLIKNKIISLYNIFHKRHKKQNEYENTFRLFIKNNAEVLINNLEIGNKIVIYFNHKNPFVQTLTRNKDSYKISFSEKL